MKGRVVDWCGLPSKLVKTHAFMTIQSSELVHFFWNRYYNESEERARTIHPGHIYPAALLFQREGFTGCFLVTHCSLNAEL